MISQSQEDLGSLGHIPRYLLEVNIDWDSRSFNGRGKIWMTNNESVALEEIYLRLYPNGHRIYGNGQLTVNRVAVSGETVETEEEVAGTALRVPLPVPLGTGEALQVEVDFQGIVPQDATGYGIYNFNEGIMVLADWYPILAVYDEDGWNLDPVYGWGDAVYSDTALYQVKVTVPRNVQVVASGVVAEQETLGGKTVYAFLTGPAREFTIAVSDQWQSLSREVGATTVNSYFLPEDGAAGRVALEQSAQALEFFNTHFGLYPYRELDILVVPMEGAGGMEYPGLILIDQEAVNARVIAHEVAHQWWYGVVGNDVLEEPWVDEALATYSSLLYLEEAIGPEAYAAGLDLYQFRYEEAQDITPGRLVTEPVSSFPGGAGYFGIVYAQGALFYDDLRTLIGKDSLYQALQNYYVAFKYDIATGDDLLQYLDDATEQALNSFYQEWLFTPGAGG